MRKILLVEDSRVIAHAIERVLAKAGYEVTVAKDGESGLELARSSSPALILLDMMLPKVSGPEVLKALKQDESTRAIPVVVLSSLSRSNEAKLIKDGAAGFVAKEDMTVGESSKDLLETLHAILSDG